MGYLFCTMSSPEIIGSLIILSLWSRLKAQAHQGAETGAVFVVLLPVEPRGAAFPGALAWSVDSLSHRGSQAAGRWHCPEVDTTASQQGARVQILTTTTY